jgi:transcription antitermination factor NusG
MINWYAAVTHPFQELTAETHLRRQGFNPFNPKVEVLKVNGSRETLTRKSLIGGYIFIPFDVDEPGWRVINSTRGVKQLMYGAHEKPARIRQDAMQVILDKCNGQIVKAEEVYRELERVLWKGAKVVPKDGPFQGYTGTVDWVRKDRSKVMMNFLGGLVPVEFKTKELEIVT